ncbi:MAG: tRNA preQ1(34) S-adenosylmethionine ribosyltransferase-isomerase QueA [Planctomycetota bacterium]|jgi:S-adenosylmethionine:tRNA ribosyltransferase-isomerase
MKTDKLNYHLPPELIAQWPVDNRSESRLLVLSRSNGQFVDTKFNRIGDYLRSGDCLVLNDTKVLPARFFAKRNSGTKLEGLFLRETQKGVWEVMLKGLRKVKSEEKIYLNGKLDAEKDGCYALLLKKTGEGKCIIKLETDEETKVILENIGFPPLPPYIKRTTNSETAEKDKQRYQTVYARSPGAVAAPTAGLHFTKELIEQLKAKQIDFAYVTLHVGAGTFRPVKTENLEEHEIHKEWFSIDQQNAGIINVTKKKEGKIIAVGTTSVRTLETMATDDTVAAGDGNTKLFIKPGYEFKMVDAMITNFHLPKSTLLALAAAFAGLENILKAYKHAIEKRYRFYSYGDVMLII